MKDRRPWQQILVRALAVMLSFAGSLKVFVAVEACDMRKGFNGLHALVAERLGEDLKQGALFVFSNRRHTRIKIIWEAGTAQGLGVLTKRLEQELSRGRKISQRNGAS